ncbi:MAG TPA: WD40 repeat domain-containing protein [Pirellulales bacterium]|nr:WD40 repeat domain-containing protein [Pirellulales bacterium]
MTRTGLLAVFALGTCFVPTAPAADIKPVATLTYHHEPIQSLAFTPKGDRLVSVAYKEIVLTDLKDPANTKIFSAFQPNEYAWGTPRVRSDGLYIAVGGTYYVNSNTMTYPCSIRLFRIGEHREAIPPEVEPRSGGPEPPRGPEQPKFRIVERIDPAGEVGATQADDYEHDTMSEVAFSTTNARLAAVRYNSVKKKYVLGLYDAESRQTNNDAVYTSDSPLKLIYTPDGKTLVTADAKGKVILWKTANATRRNEYETHKGAVHDLAVDPDSKTLATAGDDKTVKLWDLEKGELKHTLAGHTDAVLCVAYSRDGKYLASGGKDHNVKLWDAATGKELATIEAHLNSVTCLAFAPDGKTLATGSTDKEVRLWDVDKALKPKSEK